MGYPAYTPGAWNRACYKQLTFTTPPAARLNLEHQHSSAGFQPQTARQWSVQEFIARSNYNVTEDLWRNLSADGPSLEALEALTGGDRGKASSLQYLHGEIRKYNDAFRKQHGKSDPRALALLAGITATGAAGLAAGDAEASLGERVLEKADGVATDIFDALEMPWQHAQRTRGAE